MCSRSGAASVFKVHLPDLLKLPGALALIIPSLAQLVFRPNRFQDERDYFAPEDFLA
jgi:hypothetical protein